MNTTKTKKSIIKVWIEHTVDTDPDLSWLGVFSDKPGEFAIKHEPNNSRTWAYFNAENVENMEQAQQNYNQMMKYENGHANQIGITAMASIKIADTIQTLTSFGLWGIDNDSNESYIAEINKEQLDDLCNVLHETGFTKEEIADSISGEMEIKDN